MANDDLFSSLISDVKTYSGKDPLLPWIRGIRKMKESLPSPLLNKKLPRFLQKCTQTFESDRRYRDDLRYLRVWLHLMDFVDDPRGLLRTMEEKHIGSSRSLFYQAYALYYEKLKKFDEAEKMYHLGVQRLAEPMDELQKSYEQFLHRMKRHNNKILHHQGNTGKRALSARTAPPNYSESKEIYENIGRVEVTASESLKNGSLVETQLDGRNMRNKIDERSTDVKQKMSADKGVDEPGSFSNDDPVVVKFVDKALFGKSEAEDACHHGLVEPTINMKEAMNAINSMFSEPLETGPISRRSHKNIHPKSNHISSGGLNVFVDENSSTETAAANHSKTEIEPLQVFVDDEANNELEKNDIQNSEEGSISITSCENVFVFPNPKDLPCENSDKLDLDSARENFREDTVVSRFVGSAILEEPVVENVCHHGLVEPTVNLKEAMEDINSMFGKPIDFVRTKRSKKREKSAEKKEDFGGFSILSDDDSECAQVQPSLKTLGNPRECDLFEPTLFTKEAMDEINKLFGMPL